MFLWFLCFGSIRDWFLVWGFLGIVVVLCCFFIFRFFSCIVLGRVRVKACGSVSIFKDWEFRFRVEEGRRE